MEEEGDDTNTDPYEIWNKEFNAQRQSSSLTYRENGVSLCASLAHISPPDSEEEERKANECEGCYG